MTKIKKVFLTITSALCCVVCVALALLGILPEQKALADGVAYETATVYDVSQLSSSGPANIVGDTKTNWFAGKQSAITYEPFNYNNKGYAVDATTVDSTTTYTLKSIGIVFKMKVDNAWTATRSSAIRLFICNTEVRWNYNATNGFKLEVFDWNEASVANRADGKHYLTDFDETEYHTYKIVKSLVVGDSSSYKLDVYIDGVQEYTASFSSITPAQNSSWAVDQLRLYNNGGTTGNTSSITVMSSHTVASQDSAKDVYDYYASNDYLSGKAFASAYDEEAGKATLNADMFDRTGMTDVSADSFGLTFKAKFDTDVVAGREVLRARIGSTYDVRLSVVTAGVEGKAQINAFDWRSNSASNKVLGAAAYQFDIDFTQEHTYTFLKEKISDTTSGYVYSAYVDGVLIQRAVYNVAPVAGWGGSNDYTTSNRIRIAIQNGNYTGTFRSANYYGVKVDGNLNVVDAGEAFTLSYTGENLFFGFTDGTNFYKNNDQITEYKELTTLSMNVYNDKGAYVRFLHEGTASLKWTAHINKADLTKLQEVYGAENVIIERRVTADWDTDTEIRKIVAVADMVDNGTEYSFSQILSKIKQKNFDKDFNYTTVVSVKNNGETLFTYEVENDNVRSIQTVATRAYNDVKTAEEWNALTDAQKEQYKHLITVETDAYKDCYSKFSAAQRAILEQYLANVEA